MLGLSGALGGFFLPGLVPDIFLVGLSMAHILGEVCASH